MRLFSDKEFTHGPCASATIGLIEYDVAFCLRCDVWPNNAKDCIRRLVQSAWPSHATIRSMVNDGVLFVPIGAKQSIFENTEWRMSFPLAEKKLIHAMNHTQFLCYGLLKIFLKQAIDISLNVKGLLCSYFLKTALFREITTASKQWNPSSLIKCFWMCFQRLLQWINCSYCPNFFVPQNNMFEGKTEGTNRDKLLQHLRILYCEGYSCLLRCQSLAPYMSDIVHRSDVVFVAEEQTRTVIAYNIIQECFLSIGSTTGNHISPNLIAYQLVSTTNDHKRFILKTWLNCLLLESSISDSYHISNGDGSNRSNYQTLTKKMNIVDECRIDSVSHFLCQALLCYNHGRYNHALRLVQQSKEKILAPRSMCPCNITPERYRDAGGDNLPIETMLRRHFVSSMLNQEGKDSLELYIESRCCGKNAQLSIPPLVRAFFLQYLCQRRLGSLREANWRLSADEWFWSSSLSLLPHVTSTGWQLVSRGYMYSPRDPASLILLSIQWNPTC